MVAIALGDLVRALGPWLHWSSIVATSKGIVRYASSHTGLPAILVAGVLVWAGYRILRRTLRWALEIAVVSIALAAATRFGWIHW
jgi:hypothetical protein